MPSHTLVAVVRIVYVEVPSQLYLPLVALFAAHQMHAEQSVKPLTSGSNLPADCP